MYRDQYHPKVKKDLKKLDRSLRQAIETIHVPAILENPDIGGGKFYRSDRYTMTCVYKFVLSL